jgi:uncharacterized membrane protein
MTPAELWRRWTDLFESEDSPDEPFYDPVHLAGVLVACLVVIGALFWLLWTLLVYEGGLPSKLAALASVLFGGKSLSDYGWTGAPDRPGVFEGWPANVAALIIACGALAALHNAARRGAPRR